MIQRKRPTKDVEAAVLMASRRKCCLCYYLDDVKARRKGQIAHLNHDPTDSRFSNLVFLCIDHHDEYDSPTSQSKGITELELSLYRARLYEDLSSKRPVLESSNDVLPMEIAGPDGANDYDQVRKSFPKELDFISKPWRYALWQTPNEPELFAYKAGNRADGVCLIERIDLPDGRTVIVCIQIAGNPGNSITNCVEELCFQVCERFEIDAAKLVWLEHYHYDSLVPQDDWRMVRFAKYPPRAPFEGPKWTSMTPAMWGGLMLRPKRNLLIRYGRYESKVHKLFPWPAE